MPGLILLIISGLLSFSACASVVIMGTRVVYPEQKKSINVQLQNGDNSPSLIQAWLDTGDASGSPGSVRVPFVITPPVSRIEPGTGQTLRIMYTGEPLPQDRESVFYLNVLDIPPRPESGGKKADVGNVNYLQLAVRSRIKLFFRPATLNQSVADAARQVTWSLVNRGNQIFLRADNQTPYFVTYKKIALKSDRDIQSLTQPGMVSPYSVKEFALPGKNLYGASVIWTVINDYGGYEEGKSSIK
ncbi:fimbria/pilus periplasmic chaperone [Salmonella enterica]|nr:fimbria/pilus periplasmic chaperone [Salmonella enterica]HBC0143946.1 fimbria/pilus periplasmic chaperone [Salmonella enterica subsp. indica serovar 11:b:e,n,x]HCM1935176.1 fimbria/pilus periplasmic chaperone [Salmonella enterica subsp. indica serovar 6,7:z41:1,7]EHN2305347.1 fimbria/pilus periplasmic chaperone [Salmonella enterica]EIO3478817.1 fimbria/pilus periplasmic chaperone [Salmonella enterica]EJS8595411.1 fimbria/pilus periplasmic chaperone [Salmonella enterica]